MRIQNEVEKLYEIIGMKHSFKFSLKKGVADYNLEKSPFTGKPGRRVKKSVKSIVEWILNDLELEEMNLRKLNGI